MSQICADVGFCRHSLKQDATPHIARAHHLWVAVALLRDAAGATGEA